METSGGSSSSSRAMVQVLLLVLAVQVTLAQHWSYGWLPGGKRSVGELEATIRMMGTGGGEVPLLEESRDPALERLRPYGLVGGGGGGGGDEAVHFQKKKRLLQQ
ncbi:hypothetical protein CRUP_024884 [Coryphaenoides rupestris]|nr:hypothetical protein CRUP_024884 [Coryphaenoides rupestris]